MFLNWYFSHVELKFKMVKIQIWNQKKSKQRLSDFFFSSDRAYSTTIPASVCEVQQEDK